MWSWIEGFLITAFLLICVGAMIGASIEPLGQLSDDLTRRVAAERAAGR